MNRPDNVEDLYALAPEAIAGIVGGTNYVRHVMDGGQALMSVCPHVQGFFSPTTRVVVIHPAVSARFAEFFRTAMRRQRSVSPNEAAERWQLGLVKSDLVVLTAAILRGVGPADERVMRHEWASVWQSPGAHAMANGAPEAVAMRIVDRVADYLGLSDRDPRLLEVAPLQRHYVAQADAVDDVTRDVAQGLGTSPAVELLALPRLGSGELAMWGLGRRYSGAQEFDAADLLDKPGGWVEFHHAISTGMAGITRDWADGHEGTVGFEQDEHAGEDWSHTISREVRNAAKRLKAGPGKSVDLARFGTSIAQAAAEAEAELNVSMDALQDVWAMLEGGVEA